MAELSDLDRMLVEHACETLVNAYALASDRADYEALAAMYTPDGVFARPTAPDSRIVGRAEILAHSRPAARPPTGTVMANTVIEAVSATEATGECYIVLYRGPAGEGGGLPAMTRSRWSASSGTASPRWTAGGCSRNGWARWPTRREPRSGPPRESGDPRLFRLTRQRPSIKHLGPRFRGDERWWEPRLRRRGRP
ncbi:MAG: nuclear transport factor 2 family protein [Caulobacteraceae bacterium]